VPMLLGGDEFRRTQHGNNNAYCQDNETSWYDWRYLEQHQDVVQFARAMTALRRAHPVLAREQFYTEAEISWFNPSKGLPDWSDPHARQLACLIHDGVGDALYLMFNASTGPAAFQIPALPGGVPWRVAVDTYQEAPQGSPVAGTGLLVDIKHPYRMESRSSALLIGATTAALKQPWSRAR